MRFTEEERARYEAEHALFKQHHADCNAMRHSVSGSLTTHCGKCCPPPPMSPSQRETIARLLGRPTPPNELMRWKLRLYCGHVIERTAHYTHKTLHAAFAGSTSCPECGLDPATIIDGEAVGLEEEPPRSRRAGTPATKAKRLQSRRRLSWKPGYANWRRRSLGCGRAETVARSPLTESSGRSEPDQAVGIGDAPLPSPVRRVAAKVGLPRTRGEMSRY